MLEREDQEELTPGLSCYWLLDHRIVVFEALQASRIVVDIWVNSVIREMANWPYDRPYLVLHDFRAKNIALTPYARKRAQDLIPISSRTPGFAAIVVGKSFVAQMIKLFMRTQRAGNIDNQLFFDYDEGLNWLKSKMNEPEAAYRGRSSVDR